MIETVGSVLLVCSTLSHWNAHLKRKRYLLIMCPPDIVEGIHDPENFEKATSRDTVTSLNNSKETNEARRISMNAEESQENVNKNMMGQDRCKLPPPCGTSDPDPEATPQQAFSDDDVSVSDDCLESEATTSLESNSESESESSDTDSESESALMTFTKRELLEEIDEEDEAPSGPILSKNEVREEVVPTLPSDYKIPENSALEYVGEVSAVVERNVIVKANISGEFRVLKENSVLCFENKQILGLLYETFGRLQSPNYRVKFNNDDDFEKVKNKKGAKVFYVVSESQFLYTDNIRKLKGTDASNCHDEELPEDEQEFSDDEQEMVAKQEKKRKRQQKQLGGNAISMPPKRKQQGRSDQSFISYGFANREQNQDQDGHFKRDIETLHPSNNVLSTNILPYSYATHYAQPIPSAPYQNYQSPQYGQQNHLTAPTQESFGANPFHPHSANNNSWTTPSYPEGPQPLPYMPSWNHQVDNSFYPQHQNVQFANSFDQQHNNQWNSHTQNSSLSFQQQHISPQVPADVLRHLQHLIASQTSSPNINDRGHKGSE